MALGLGLFIMHDLKLKSAPAINFLKPTIVGVIFCATLAASAQSTRPGWGATPYHDSNGTGVTFRVWAPHATNVYLPGNFNGYNITAGGATKLIQETTNGTPDGIWSLDVAGVTNYSQYKFYFNGYLWKQDPRARMVTQAGSGGNSVVYDPNAFNQPGIK